MNEVKRYGFRLSAVSELMGGHLELVEYSGDGQPFVLASDYDALAADCERLRRFETAYIEWQEKRSGCRRTRNLKSWASTAMLDAAWCACSGLDDGDIRDMWRAMLTATPTPGEGKCD